MKIMINVTGPSNQEGKFDTELVAKIRSHYTTNLIQVKLGKELRLLRVMQTGLENPLTNEIEHYYD